MTDKKLIRTAIIFFIAMILLGLGSIAFAQDAPPDPEKSLTGVVAFIIAAFQGGQFWVVGATVVMLLVWGAGKVFTFDSKWASVWAAGVAMLLGVVAELMKPDINPLTGIWLGLLGNGNAALFWSLLGKRIFPKPKPPKPKPKPVPVSP